MAILRGVKERRIPHRADFSKPGIAAFGMLNPCFFVVPLP
jgi:hypothetical protein